MLIPVAFLLEKHGINPVDFSALGSIQCHCLILHAIVAKNPVDKFYKYASLLSFLKIHIYLIVELKSSTQEFCLK